MHSPCSSMVRVDVRVAHPEPREWVHAHVHCSAPTQAAPSSEPPCADTPALSLCFPCVPESAALARGLSDSNPTRP